MLIELAFAAITLAALFGVYRSNRAAHLRLAAAEHHIAQLTAVVAGGEPVALLEAHKPPEFVPIPAERVAPAPPTGPNVEDICTSLRLVNELSRHSALSIEAFRLSPHDFNRVLGLVNESYRAEVLNKYNKYRSDRGLH